MKFLVEVYEKKKAATFDIERTKRRISVREEGLRRREWDGVGRLLVLDLLRADVAYLRILTDMARINAPGGEA